MKKLDTVYIDSDGNRHDLTPFKTPMGRTISFKIVGDHQILLQWTINKTRILPDTLYLSSDPSIPRFIDENKDYIVLRSGCGSQCWTGYFLPVNNTGKPSIINEYLAYNLNEEFAAQARGQDTIVIRHLKTAKMQIHHTDSCSSVFPAYCIDSIAINNKTLYYRWSNSASTGNKGKWTKARINI